MHLEIVVLRVDFRVFSVAGQNFAVYLAADLDGVKEVST